MTGYAHQKKSFKDFEVSIEIAGVNKRHLDIQMKLSSELMTLDSNLRKIVSDSIGRGNVSISVRISFVKEYPVKMAINKPLVKQYASIAKEISKEFGYQIETELTALLDQPGILETEISDERLKNIEKSIVEVLQIALSSFVKEKEREGKALLTEFLERIKILETKIKAIEKLSLGMKEKVYAKLQKSVEELVGKYVQNDERLFKEAALLAEKADVSEEISRFQIHLQHFKTTCSSKEKTPKGKLLEFIIQELHREINTICAKSQDAQMTTDALFAKSEIEKLKEQVQNVE